MFLTGVLEGGGSIKKHIHMWSNQLLNKWFVLWDYMYAGYIPDHMLFVNSPVNASNIKGCFDVSTEFWEPHFTAEE